MINEGLISTVFEHTFKENCPITAVNTSYFLPCDFSNKIPPLAFRQNAGSSLQEVNFSENIAK